MKRTVERIVQKDGKFFDSKGNEVKAEQIGTNIEDTFYTQRQDGDKNILEHLSKLQMEDREYEKADAFTELYTSYVPGEKIERTINFYKIISKIIR